MPWPVILMLNNFMKTNKTFQNTKKRCPFHYRGLEYKSRKSRHTWSNRQIWPWSKEWSRAKANRVLPRECTGYSKHPPPTAQERIYTWNHWNVYVLFFWTLHSDGYIFSFLLYLSLLFSAICEVSSDNHSAFFLFLLWDGLKYMQ